MEPYIGEIRLFAFDYQPQGWLLCNGQLFLMEEYPMLVSLLGNMFGGDGRSTFAVPDLRGRVPIHYGQRNGFANYVIGEKGGQNHVQLEVENLPKHSHGLLAFSEEADTDNPVGNTLANSRSNTYASPGMTPPPVLDVMMNGKSITPAGSGADLYNVQPSLTMNFYIAFEGIYPPRQ